MKSKSHDSAGWLDGLEPDMSTRSSLKEIGLFGSFWEDAAQVRHGLAQNGWVCGPLSEGAIVRARRIVDSWQRQLRVIYVKSASKAIADSSQSSPAA